MLFEDWSSSSWPFWFSIQDQPGTWVVDSLQEVLRGAVEALLCPCTVLWSVKNDTEPKPRGDIGNCVAVNWNRNRSCETFHRGSAPHTILCLYRTGVGGQWKRKSALWAFQKLVRFAACSVFRQMSVRFKISLLCHNFSVTGSYISFNTLLFCGKIKWYLAWITSKIVLRGVAGTLAVDFMCTGAVCLGVGDKEYPKALSKCMHSFWIFFWWEIIEHFFVGLQPDPPACLCGGLKMLSCVISQGRCRLNLSFKIGKIYTLSSGTSHDG